MLGPNDALVLDDAGMDEALEHHDLVRELRDLLLRFARERDPLHGDHPSRVEVQRAVD